MGGTKLLRRMVWQFCLYSGTTVFKSTKVEANGFELCQYNEHRLEAENNCACVLRVFQSLPLARDG